jgi:hypothetical protein
MRRQTYCRTAHAFTNYLRVAVQVRDVARIVRNFDTCLRGEATRWQSSGISDIIYTQSTLGDNDIKLLYIHGISGGFLVEGRELDLVDLRAQFAGKPY